MKIWYYALLAGTVLLFGSCQPTKSVSDWSSIPSEEDFQSVLLLNDHAGHVASAFVHIRNGRLYIVSARHFAGYLTREDSIGIFLDGHWNMLAVQLVGHSHGDVDISVFTFGASSIQKSFDQTPVLSGKDSLSLGCEVWYLGFPLGFVNTDSERRYPYPLLKHAYLSTRSKNPNFYFFDGYCNPGFSGGPVYARTTEGKLRLIGVVSYRLEEKLNHDLTDNAGIFTAYSAEYADSLIDANPIGTVLH